MESRGKEEERQGTEEEGKAEKEGAPPWGRRARKMQQRRHDLWYDEGDQTKTSRPKKGRHEILYHTACARDVHNLRTCIGGWDLGKNQVKMGKYRGTRMA